MMTHYASQYAELALNLSYNPYAVRARMLGITSTRMRLSDGLPKSRNAG
jgi:hypothetical protein